MDFNKLMNTMRELDGATQHTTNETDSMMPGMPMMVNSEPMEPSGPEASPLINMDVNINAQGLDSIEGLMSLFQKVNPDMISQGDSPISDIDGVAPNIVGAEPDIDTPDMDMPGMGASEIDAPTIEIEPIEIGPGEPNAPSFDAEPDTDNDAVVDPAEKDSDAEFDTELGNVVQNAFGKQDDSETNTDAANDALADEPAPEPEEELPTDTASDSDSEEKDEAWDNSPQEKEFDIDTMVNKLSGGLNDAGAKTYPKVAGGDNPMQQAEATGNGISPEALQGLEDLSMDELMQKAAELIKQSHMTDKKKMALLRNVSKSYSPKNILGLLWNSVLGKEGLHAVGSSWGGRFENKEQKVASVKEQLWAALNEKKGITNENNKPSRTNESVSQFELLTSLMIDDDDPEVSVEFDVGGSYYPATRFQPEEFPEIEINKITAIETGQDLTDYVHNNRRIFNQLHAEIEEKLNRDSDEDEDNRRPSRGYQRFEDESSEMAQLKRLSGQSNNHNDPY